MHTVSSDYVEQASLSDQRRGGMPAAAVKARAWLAARLQGPGDAQKAVRTTLAATCAVIFFSALGVRLLYWQDNAVQMSIEDTLSRNMALQYRREARRILEQGTILFPREQVDPGDARMIIHPPGYSMVMAASFKLFGETETPLRVLQIICDAAAAVVVFFIAAELFPLAAAIIAALLMALSPHSAYYSLRLSPDSLAVLPILLAVYLIISTSRRPRLHTIAAAGVMLGLSCWLRANSLLLAPFLAIVIAMLFARGKRLRYSTVLVAAAAVVISPITIRNWVVYHHLIPVALPAGVNLVQGIAEFDKEGKFGMPLSDPDVLRTDVEWNSRPDYGGHMWTPDGIQRDRTRFARGLEVIRSHPLWYLGAMVRRATFMLSYNESRRRDWPFNTATVPLISTRPPFGHSISSVSGNKPIWSSAAADLISGGRALSAGAEVSLAANGETLQIAGAGSEFEDQFVSAPISVRRNTDYLLTLPARIRQGQAAAKVIGADERVVLASASITTQGEPTGKKAKRFATELAETAPAPIRFASGDAAEVRLVLSNNGATSERPVVEVGKADLFELGPTPTLWTNYPRVIIRGIERNIFKTAFLLPLIIAGIALLAIARRGRALLTLLAVPVYYIVTHAPFSTEYRYILAIHCFLFVTGAVTLYCAGLLTGNVIGRWRGIISRQHISSQSR
ncbi:MAG: glycosyltransferase family 39 protein [Acidobacteriota bacterium]